VSWVRAVGLDLSLTATGIDYDAGPQTISVKSQGVPRLADISQAILDIVRSLPAELVVIEGYSYASANVAHQLGELGGVVRLALWSHAVPYVVVQPASLKVYATGKGNANKDEVLAAAIRRLGYAGADHNQADACWLRQMALAHYGDEKAVTVPATHAKALAAVKWPKLREAVG
jgi:Holliday junction resolvasome RuvABC endonuclease subunit